MNKLKHIIHFIRPYQWIKNLFIFVPAFFGGEILAEDNFLMLLAGFASFSFVASSIYIFNDIRDIEFDRQHPIKKDRPLPSGQISTGQAWIFSAVLILAGTASAAIIQISFLYIVLGYTLLNILYSLTLKRIAILDIFLISFGFALRIVAGGVLTEVPISRWLIIMIFLLSLFLGIAKRREDVLIQGASGQTTRNLTSHYSLEFINAAMIMFSAVILVAYLMYTMSSDIVQRTGNENIYTTGIFVVAGILRYMQLTFVYNLSGNPTRLLFRDPVLLFCVIGWLGLFYFLLYI